MTTSKHRRRQVIARDGVSCHLCRLPTDPDADDTDPNQATLDRIIPGAQGGTYALGNVVLAHRRCNEQRGDRPLTAVELAGARARISRPLPDAPASRRRQRRTVPLLEQARVTRDQRRARNRLSPALRQLYDELGTNSGLPRTRP